MSVTDEKFKNKSLFLLALFLIVTGEVSAHHPGHGSSSTGTRTTFYQGAEAKPSSRVYGLYDFAQIDNSVGQLHTWTLGSEWTVHKRISILGDVPIAYLAHNFKENTVGLGDIALGGKYLFLDEQRFFSFLSVLWSFPTGDEQDALGRGSVGQQMDLFGGLKWADWTFFLTPGVNFGYVAPHEPIVNVSIGASTPKIQERLYFSLSANTQVFVVSDVFDNGSWKLFLEPQINWIADKNNHVTLSLSGRVSLVDQLSRKSGVTLTNTSNALLNDVHWGFTTGVHYTF